MTTERVTRVDSSSPFAAFVRFGRPYWKAYLGGAGLALVFMSFELSIPIIVPLYLTMFTGGNATMGTLWGFFGLLMGIAVLAGIARYGQRMLMIGASRDFEYDLRNSYFRKVQEMDPAFFSRMPTGDIMARATNDINYARLLLGPGIMGTVDIIRVPFTVLVMLYFSTRLTLIALIPMPFVSLMVYGIVMYMHRQSKVVQELFGKVTARAQENLAGARVVKAYGVADLELRDFREDSSSYMWQSLRLAAVQSLFWPLTGSLVIATILLVLWQGGMMVIDQDIVMRPYFASGVRFDEGGSMPHLTGEAIRLGRRQVPFEAEDLFGFLMALGMLAWPLTQFGWVLTLYQRGAAGMARILDVLTASPAIADPPQPAEPETIDGALAFDRVDFAHDGRPVIEDVSFHIEPGRTLALVGPTGSGKTTIARLITRDYDPASGAVLIDGIDIRQLSLKRLHEAVAIVPQDAFLFSASIRDNVAFSRPDASDDEVVEACRLAQMHETIASFPDGYDTLLGERGVNLSGGQKQRLTIARALIAQTPILILDDALSSVDTHTEEELLTALREAARSRTVVLIAHRISSVSHADLILVLEDGKVVERGTHAELLALDGEYAAMYRRQLIEEELEATE